MNVCYRFQEFFFPTENVSIAGYTIFSLEKLNSLSAGLAENIELLKGTLYSWTVITWDIMAVPPLFSEEHQCPNPETFETYSLP
jgi:hypothetical protein